MNRMDRIISLFLALVTVTGMLPFTAFDAKAETNILDDAAEFNGHYYKVFVDSTIGWHDAAEACEKMGGHLATITSAEENRFVFNLVNPYKIEAWIGGTDETEEGVWEWITGEEWSYKNARFDNYQGIQDYAVINHNHNGSWSAIWDDQAEGPSAGSLTGGYVCEWDTTVKREDGFNFYMNYASNYINVGYTVELHIGYYLDNSITGSERYIYTVSDSNVINVRNAGWSDKYGQKLKITAKKEGTSTITVTNPENGEVSALDIHVTSSESAWTFYNIPKMSIENGKTTNFYNYSGMVVDEFAYTEKMDASGQVDHYNVTMTVWNSLSLYGVVTSHREDGSVYAYQIIDKKDQFVASLAESFKALYYNVGDWYYLTKNDKYYSGKGVSTENKVSIDVPVGGYLSITNNVAASDVANVVNFLHLFYDVTCFMTDFAEVGEGLAQDEVFASKDIIIKNLIDEILENQMVNQEVLGSFRKSVMRVFHDFNLNYDDLGGAVKAIAGELLRETGINLLDELKQELCSVTGVLALGEKLGAKVLPTGWAIEFVHSMSDGFEFVVFFGMYTKSKNFPSGISIYSPTDSGKYQSNGISIDTDHDMTDTVVHAYTVADTRAANISERTFAHQAVFYNDRYQTYNITLYKNGTETQPDSAVTVKVPIPAGFDIFNHQGLKVYRNNEDGSLTDMNAWVEGDYMVFVTDHFSYYSIVDESVPQATEELKFSGASLTLQDALTVNYKVNETLLTESGYQAPYVRFVMNDMETVMTDYYILDGKLVFDFENIAPNQMKDTIYATLYATREGVVYESETREYCVTDYCYNMLEKCTGDEYSELRTLLVDILHYGAASQTFSGYRTDALANGALTAEQLAWGTAEAPTMTDVLDREYAAIETPLVNWKGAGLNLLESVTMRFKIEADSAEDLSVKITNDLGDAWIIYEDRFEAIEGGYYVYFDGLNADEMSQTVYLTVYDGLTPVSNTIRYSIESYACSKQTATDENLSALVIAMMKYGKAAWQYNS